MKNILAENMLRFGVKNLDVNNKLKLTALSEQADLQQQEKQLDVNLMTIKQKQQTLAVLQAEVDEANAKAEDEKLKANIQSLTTQISELTKILTTKRTLSRDARNTVKDQLKTYTTELQKIRSQIDPPATQPKLPFYEKVEKWISIVGTVIASAVSVVALQSNILDLKQKQKELDQDTDTER